MVTLKLVKFAYTVTNGDTEAVADNPNREYLLIQNDSDTAIYLAFGETAEVNKGVRLSANGGAYEMSRPVGNLTTLSIRAISSVTTKKICGVEG